MESHPTLDNWILLRTLGSGGYSKVKLGQHQTTEQMAAIKILKSTPSTLEPVLQMVSAEVTSLRQVDHPNIVRILDHNDNGTYTNSQGAQRPAIYIALELCPKGELFDFVFQTGYFSERICRFYAR